MRLNYSKLWIRVISLCLSVVLLSVSFLPVQATKEVDELEDATSGLESELSNLNKELKALNNELDDILEQIDDISSDLEKTREELSIAKGKEEEQYESMELRIKYMYENGGLSFMEILFTSSCLAEFLNQAEYIMAITAHDRQQLDDLTKTREEIAKKEAKLQEDQAYLVSLQETIDKKEKELEEKIASTSADLSKYITKLENARANAENAQDDASKPIKPSTSENDQSSDSGESSKPSSGTTSNGSAVAATASDVELLAALLECEAGSTNYEALLAVGSVVVNRMKSRYYPDTLKGVIYQSGQFPPAHDGKVDRVLKRGVKPLCVQAAKDALNGKNNVGNCLSFRASSSGREGIVIGDNVFF